MHTYWFINHRNLLQLIYLWVVSIIPSYFRVLSRYFQKSLRLFPLVIYSLISFLFENLYFIRSYRFFDLYRVFGKCFVRSSGRNVYVFVARGQGCSIPSWGSWWALFCDQISGKAKQPSIDSGNHIPTVPTWSNHLGPTREWAQVSCKYVESEDVVFVPNIPKTRRSEIDTLVCSTTCGRQRTNHRANVVRIEYSFQTCSFKCIKKKMKIRSRNLCFGF